MFHLETQTGRRKWTFLHFLCEGSILTAILEPHVFLVGRVVACPGNFTDCPGMVVGLSSCHDHTVAMVISMPKIIEETKMIQGRRGWRRSRMWEKLSRHAMHHNYTSIDPDPTTC